MAVTPGYVTSVAITWASSATATASSASIGTATWDRLVVVGITVEETATINTVTIGGITATSAISVRNTTGTPDNACALFYARVPTGTTANIVVTLSASSTQTGRISIWAVTGAMTPPINTNSGQGSGATQTLAGITIPSAGAGFWVFNNATSGTAVTWTNATERDDTAVTNYQHSAADTTTAGTPTVTADGATANQILAGMSLAQLPPGEGWDQTPQNSRMPFPRPRTAAIALAAASGLVWVPQPVTQLGTGPQNTLGFTVSTSQVRTKSLFYQAWATRPPGEPPAPAVTPAESESFSVIAERRGTRTLHYQAKVEPLPAPTAVVVADIGWHAPFSAPPPRRLLISLRQNQPFVPALAPAITPDEWLQPFKRQVAGPFPVHTQPVMGFPAAPQVTPDEWLQPFQKAVSVPKPVHTQPLLGYPYEQIVANTPDGSGWELVTDGRQGPPRQLLGLPGGQPFIPREATLDNTVTPDKWLIAWKGPPRSTPAAAGGSPFVPKEATLENTLGHIAWLQPFYKAAPVPPARHTQPFYGFPYVALPNLTTTLEWQIAWQGPPRVLQRLPGGQPFVPKGFVQDVVTPDKWLQSFKAPPRYWPVKVQTPPFVPREAVLDNTVTPDAWLFRFQGAVPRSPVRHTQPFFGYPYVAASNLTTSIEWLRPFDRAVPIGRPAERTSATLPPYPYTTDAATSQSFSVIAERRGTRTLFYQTKIGPVKEPPPPPPNLTTTLEWMPGWQKAVPIRRPALSQPFFGYPYYQTDTCEPAFQQDAFQNDAFQVCRQEIKGWFVPLSEPKARTRLNASQITYTYPPVVVANLTTTLEWLPGWQKAVPIRRPVLSQPFYGFPYLGVDNTVTIDKWAFRWQGPPRYWPPGKPHQPFVPRAAVLENTVTPDKWLLRWQGPPRYWWQGRPYQPFVPPAAIVETVTPDKWLLRWQGPPRYWPPRILAQPFVPREATRENTVTPDKWLFRFAKAVPHGWPRHTQPFFGYPYADEFPEGGPADESERVVCVPSSSRTAVEPGLLRTATVPLEQRVATVPELMRVAYVPEASRVVNSNDYRDRPCHDT